MLFLYLDHTSHISHRWPAFLHIFYPLLDEALSGYSIHIINTNTQRHKYTRTYNSTIPFLLLVFFFKTKEFNLSLHHSSHCRIYSNIFPISYFYSFCLHTPECKLSVLFPTECSAPEKYLSHSGWLTNDC